MCGRYAASTHPDKLIEIFEVDEVPDALPAVGPEGLAQWSRPRWNIAPTDLVPAVLERTREQGDQGLGGGGGRVLLGDRVVARLPTTTRLPLDRGQDLLEDGAQAVALAHEPDHQVVGQSGVTVVQGGEDPEPRLVEIAAVGSVRRVSHAGNDNEPAAGRRARPTAQVAPAADWLVLSGACSRAVASSRFVAARVASGSGVGNPKLV